MTESRRQHFYRELADFDKAVERNFAFFRADKQHLACDALRIIADAIQFGVDLDGCINRAQVSGDWLLADEEFQTRAVKFFFDLVDAVVVHNDRIEQLPVVFPQGLEAGHGGLLGLHSHFDDFVANELDASSQSFF